MGFAYRVKHTYNGVIPENPDEIMTFHGIGRKICVLLFQDAFKIDHFGIVFDRHVARFVIQQKWVSNPNMHLDAMAAEVEGWLSPKYWRPLNECIGALRQLKKEKEGLISCAQELGGCYVKLLEEILE